VTEAQIQRAIIVALESLGYLVVRLHSGRLKFNGAWLRMAPEGFPDLWVVGHMLLEVKTGKGKVSPEQLAMHDRIRRAGELVAVVRTPAEAIRAVSSGRVREGQAS
jgi:hypothetical protein